MRVESPHACASGGWWHHYDESRTFLKPPPRPEKKIDANGIIADWVRRTPIEILAEWAIELGVTVESMLMLSAAWSRLDDTIAFPMFDENGSVIGIRLRNSDGKKWAVTGSRQGIFLPSCEPQKIAYLPEGPTDTAALLSLGLYTIGRPTCNGGNDILAKAIKHLKIRRAVVVADNDEMKTLGNRNGRPGIEGAVRCQQAIGIPSTIWIPPSPIKDAREFLRHGGTAIMIEADLRNKVWS
jgi:hypothetical protein